MIKFSSFTDDELDMMEEAFCNEGYKSLVNEIRVERRYREKADKCDNDHDCEHCDWVECPEPKAMTLEQNIKAILESNFSIAKDEIIEAATKRIMEQIESQKDELLKGEVR